LFVTSAQEDYLKTIWYIQNDDPVVKPAAISNYLNVKPPTVSLMLKGLSEKKLLIYDRKSGIRLTETGETQARRIIRKHRILETFLESILKMDNSAIHREAERLEHAVSDQLIDEMDAYLGHPQVDPHGSEIPRESAPLHYCKLSEIIEGTVFTIHDISDANDKDYCLRKHLVPGQNWEMLEKGPDDASLLIRMKDRHLSLSTAFAATIIVKYKRD
jgi:DtxR family Mn-dependent transcriptional regulator